MFLKKSHKLDKLDLFFTEYQTFDINWFNECIFKKFLIIKYYFNRFMI